MVTQTIAKPTSFRHETNKCFAIVRTLLIATSLAGVTSGDYCLPWCPMAVRLRLDRA